MATFRGLEGLATYGAANVANLKTWEITTSLAVIDTSVKGSKFQTVVGGQVSGTARLTCLLDAVTGQLSLITALMAASPTTTPAALVLTVDTGKTYTVQALYTGSQITSPEVEGLCTVQFDFTLSGQVTEAWA
jgi:hypothetical protein